MGTLRIGVDGFNLAMPLGGGVATYGCTLGHVLAAAGYSVEGVFGLDPGRDPARREARIVAALAAQPPASGRPPILRRAGLFLKGARPFPSLRARPVALRGALREAAGDRLPPLSRLWSHADLFPIAYRHFVLYRRFITLRVDDPPEIMHWTYPVPIRLDGARNIYTLHDLVPLRMPWATRDNKIHYMRLVRGCAETAAHICTVSEASRADIMSLLGVSPERVTSTLQATLPAPAASDAVGDAATLRRLFGLEPRGYFLFVGTIEPKKNVRRLIEAYMEIASETPLVLAGARGWQAGAELAPLAAMDMAASGLPGGGRVVQLGYLPREALALLVRSARALVFPSLMEGFGLPVLEAFHAGTPVLTSRTSSLPEIAGDAAVLIDPYSVPSIAEGLRALDGDAGLRRRLAEEGAIRAQRFSPAHYLSRLESMYESVLAFPSRSKGEDLNMGLPGGMAAVPGAEPVRGTT